MRLHCIFRAFCQTGVAIERSRRWIRSTSPIWSWSRKSRIWLGDLYPGQKGDQDCRIRSRSTFGEDWLRTWSIKWGIWFGNSAIGGSDTLNGRIMCEQAHSGDPATQSPPTPSRRGLEDKSPRAIPFTCRSVKQSQIFVVLSKFWIVFVWCKTTFYVVLFVSVFVFTMMVQNWSLKIVSWFEGC